MRSLNIYRMRSALALACATLGLCLANVAHASDYQGTVQYVFQLGNRVYVNIANGTFGGDSCGGGRTSLMLHLDATTALGKAQLAMVLGAKLAERPVYAAGSGDCTTTGTPNGSTSETLYVFNLQ